jgi:hypothetical protein
MIQTVALALDTWGIINFASDSSAFSTIITTIWNILTHQFWGACIMSASVGLIVYLGMRNVGEIAHEYNPSRPPGRVLTQGTRFSPDPPPGRIHFFTYNNQNGIQTCPYPIQAIRFVKPVSRVVREPELPGVIIPCESRPLHRIRNFIKGIPAPQIVINSFTEKGFSYVEENTNGAEVEVIMYPKQ